MKSNSLSKNFIWNLTYQVLLYTVPLVTTPYLSRVLGADGIGKYSFAQSIVSYFVLVATLGTAMYGQRKVASLKAQPAAQAAAFWQIFALRIVTTAAMLAMYAVLILPFCGNFALYAVAALDIVSVGLDISWLFQGQENFGVITLCSSFWKLMGVVLIFVLVRTPADLNRYVLIYCGATAASNLSQWLFLRKSLPRCDKIGLRGVRRHLRPALSLFVAQVAIQAYTVLDKTMIGLITRSDVQNGYYEQAQKLIRVLLAVATSMGTVMASRVAVLWIEQDQPGIQRMVETSFRVTFALCMPIAFGVVLVAARFVPLFYGAGFEGVVPLLYILALLLPVIGASNVLGIQYLVPTGKERSLTRSVGIGCLVNVALNSVLIARYQAVGAAAASVVAEICVTATQFYIVRRELDLRPVIGLFLRYLLCSLPMLAVGLAAARYAPGGVGGLVCLVLPCMLLYAAELFFLKDPAITAVFDRNR